MNITLIMHGDRRNLEVSPDKPLCKILYEAGFHDWDFEESQVFNDGARAMADWYMRNPVKPNDIIVVARRVKI